MIDWEQEDSEIAQIKSQLDHLQKTVEQEQIAFSKAVKNYGDVVVAQETLQLLAQAVQQRAHAKISEVVSSCLQAVFENPYEFKIEFERKRGRTEAKLLFSRNGLDVDPLNSTGGGVVDVAAFALRVACLVLHRPRLSKVIVLDEPFRFVSAQYRDNVRRMLEELSENMQIQMILVTHIEELATGQIIEI